MKKVMFLLLVTFFCQLLFSGNNVETGKFRVSMDDTCRDPEVLMSPEGDIYFFYIKDDKLVIELKKSGTNQFSTIENTFIDTALTVKSIKSFRMVDDSYSLLVLAQDQSNDNLFHLDFFENQLQLTNNSRIDNDLSGVIKLYNLYALGFKRHLISYIKNEIIYYTYLNNEETFKAELSLRNVSKYELGGASEEDDFLLRGYALDTFNNLNYIEINGAQTEVKFLRSFNREVNPSFYNIKNDENNKSTIVTVDDNKVYKDIIDDLVTSTVIDLPSANSRYHIWWNSKFNLISYEFSGADLKLSNGTVINDVNEFRFIYDNLYVLNLNGDLYRFDLNSSSISTMLLQGVVGFGNFSLSYNNYLLVIYKEGEFINKALYLCNNGSLTDIYTKFVDYSVYPDLQNEINNNKYSLFYQRDENVVKQYKLSTDYENKLDALLLNGAGKYLLEVLNEK